MDLASAAAWRLEDFDAATADEQLWVAECDGQPVGFAAVWTADNFLHHLFVDPDWQGKHIGSALLAQVERTFTASGTLKCLMENKTPCASTSVMAGPSKHRARRPRADTG